MGGRMVMTTPRDDIAGLSERLRDRDAIVLSGLFYCGPLMREAATQLDSLLKERDGYERLYNNEVVERLRAEQE